jgi:diguanylate cyclase (GGDEF)-like protein
MNRKSVRSNLNIVVILIAVVSITLTVAIAFITMERIRNTIAEKYIELNTKEVSARLDGYMKGEIFLIEHLSMSRKVVSWVENESDLEVKKQALMELESLRTVLKDNNIFMVFDKSNSFYYVEGIVQNYIYEPIGVIEEINPRDIWYFKMKESQNNYDLNVDVDRFLNTMRVWINMKIFDDNRNIIGAIGTGIYLDTFLNDIFSTEEAGLEKVILIDQHKSIQIDSSSENIMQNSFSESEDIDKTVMIYGQGDPSFQKAIDDYYGNEIGLKIYRINNPEYDYMSITQFYNSDWNIVSFYDSSKILSLRSIYPMIILFSLIILLSIIVLRYSVKKVMLDPLEELNETVNEAIRKERYDNITSVKNDDFGDLAVAYNILGEKIIEQNKEYENKVEERTKELSLAYRELSLTNSKLEKFVETMPIGVFKLDENKKLTFVNSEFLNLFKVDTIEEFRTLNSYLGGNPIWGSFDEIVKENDQIEREIFSFKDSSGEKIWVEMSIIRIDDPEAMVHYEGIITDVSERKLNEFDLLKKTQVDALTSAYQRDYFMSLLEEEIEHVKYKDYESVFAIYDFDNFKDVNDEYGHPAGDMVLIKITELVKNLLNKDSHLGRIGGEEFGLILSNYDSNSLEVVLEKIRKAVEEEVITYKDIKLNVTISIGVTRIWKNDSMFSVYRRADKGLYIVKNRGKNGYEVII